MSKRDLSTTWNTHYKSMSRKYKKTILWDPGIFWVGFFFSVSIVRFGSSDMPLMVCEGELVSDWQMAPEFAAPGNSRQREAAEFSCLICCLVKSPGSMPCSNLFLITCSWSYFWVSQQSYIGLFATDLIKIILVQDQVMFFPWKSVCLRWNRGNVEATVCTFQPYFAT